MGLLKFMAHRIGGIILVFLGFGITIAGGLISVAQSNSVGITIGFIVGVLLITVGAYFVKSDHS